MEVTLHLIIYKDFQSSSPELEPTDETSSHIIITIHNNDFLSQKRKNKAFKRN